jgi:hypothetical protein
MYTLKTVTMISNYQYPYDITDSCIWGTIIFLENYSCTSVNVRIELSGFDLRRGQRFLSTKTIFAWSLQIPGLESRKYVRRDPMRWPRDPFYPQKLALTSPTSGGRSVFIVHSVTKAKKLLSTNPPIPILSRNLQKRRFCFTVSEHNGLIGLPGE